MYLPHRLNLMPCIINEITISLCPPGITDGFCLEIVAKYQGHQYMWWLCRRIPQQHNTHITIYNRVLVVQFCVTTISLLYVTTILLRNSLLNEKALDYSSRYLLRKTAWFFLMCHQHFYSFRMPIFTKPSQRSNWGRGLARSARRRPPVC